MHVKKAICFYLNYIYEHIWQTAPLPAQVLLVPSWSRNKWRCNNFHHPINVWAQPKVLKLLRTKANSQNNSYRHCFQTETCLLSGQTESVWLATESEKASSISGSPTAPLSEKDSSHTLLCKLNLHKLL